MTSLAILKTALALLRQGWCQRTMAKNKAGVRVGFDEETAVEFCLVGALCRASGHQLSDGPRSTTAQNAVWKCIREKFPTSINLTQFNDDEHRRFEQIEDVMECAIDRTKDAK